MDSSDRGTVDPSRVSVILPWQDGCPHRRAALAWVRERWEQTGAQVLLGRLPEGQPWCKAAAVAAALPAAAGELLVLADADVWCDDWRAALDAVAAGAAWASPHTWVHRLAGDATRQVLGGAPPRATMRHAEPPHRAMLGGGLVMVRRDTYDRVPMDCRFIGWGSEDEAWARALRVLAGAPWRGRAALWHLWHPPQERLSRREGSRESTALLQRYRAARDPDRMRALLEEFRGQT